VKSTTRPVVVVVLETAKVPKDLRDRKVRKAVATVREVKAKARRAAAEVVTVKEAKDPTVEVVTEKVAKEATEKAKEVPRHRVAMEKATEKAKEVPRHRVAMEKATEKAKEVPRHRVATEKAKAAKEVPRVTTKKSPRLIADTADRTHGTSSRKLAELFDLMN